MLLEAWKEPGARGRRGREEPCVVLFRARGSRALEYDDPGGELNPGESPLACATRELREESLGLFRLDMESLARAGGVCRVDVGPAKRYASFVVPVRGPPGRGIVEEHYAYNRAAVRGLAEVLPGHWQETDDMARFSVSGLVDAGIMTAPSGSPRKGMVASDVHGVRKRISGRAVAAVRGAIVSGVLDDVVAGKLPEARLRLSFQTSDGLGDPGTPVWRATRGASFSYR